MKRIYYAALSYLIAGLVSGVFYRSFTKANDFTGDSQLSVVHTHFLALGMLFFLTVLALDKVFGLSGTRMVNAFFWTYNAGLALTAAMMVLNGILTVQGTTPSAAIAGIFGLGHIGPHRRPDPALHHPGQARLRQRNRRSRTRRRQLNHSEVGRHDPEPGNAGHRRSKPMGRPRQAGHHVGNHRRRGSQGEDLNCCTTYCASPCATDWPASTGSSAWCVSAEPDPDPSLHGLHQRLAPGSSSTHSLPTKNAQGSFAGSSNDYLV